MPAPTIIRGYEHAFGQQYSGNDTGQTVGFRAPFTDNGTINNSLMFDRDDAEYLQRTMGSGDRRKATLSWWFKRAGGFGNEMTFIGAGTSTRFLCRFSTSNQLVFRLSNGSSEYQTVSSAQFENSGDWYHVVWQIDVSQGTAANRSRVWVNGGELDDWASAAYPGQNTDVEGMGENGAVQRIGSASTNTVQIFDGYIAEFNFIDGSIVDVSTFGLTDTNSGQWIPKTLTGITYGSQGFRLKFQDSSSLGDDTSGQGNDFSATNLVARNQFIDTPTNNFAVMGLVDQDVKQTLSQGAMQTTTTGTNNAYPMIPQFRPVTGKWYAELRIQNTGGGNTLAMGVYDYDRIHTYGGSGNYYVGHDGGTNGSGSALWYVHGGTKQLRQGNDTQSNPSFSLSVGDILGIVLDIDNNTLEFLNNSGSSIGKVGMLANRPAFAAVSNMSGISFIWNFGQNGTFNGNETAGGNSDGNGIGNFYHTVPTGFLALCQDNLPTENEGRKYAVPDLVFIKETDDSGAPHMYDSTRGVSRSSSFVLFPNSTSAEVDEDGSTSTPGIMRLVQGGFEVTEDSGLNGDNNQYAFLAWKANGGVTSANTDGSGATIASTIQANQTAGFSIVSYTGSGSAGKIAHGLGSEPHMIWTKCRSNSTSWYCYCRAIDNAYDATPWNRYFRFDSDDSHADSGTAWNDTQPTSSVFSVGDNNTNQSSRTYIAYCFSPVEGYSASGTYSGTANANGPFIYTGFKPAIIMIKGVNIGNGWSFYSPRYASSTGGNPRTTSIVLPESSVRSTTDVSIDILSNGFKLRNSDGDLNGDYTYFYYAWAIHPFIGDGVNPATADHPFPDRGDR